MKEYLVHMVGKSYIVSAKNANDAIKEVTKNSERIKNITNPVIKAKIISRMTARSLGNLHNEYGKMIDLS